MANYKTDKNMQDGINRDIYPTNNGYRANFRVTNKRGIHARPASLLVQTAMKYDSKITLSPHSKNQKYDVKSIMHLLIAGLSHGTTGVIEAVGDDARQCLEELVGHFAQGFDEA